MTGKVIDLGGNAIAVKVLSGRRKIYIRDVRSLSFTADGRRVPRRDDADLVIRRSGDDLVGDVTLTPDGKSVVVRLEDQSVISVPRGDVLRIVRRGDEDVAGEAERSLVFTRELGESLEKAIEALSSADEKVAERAEKKLRTLGVFAVPRLEELLGSPETGSSVESACARVYKNYELRKLIPDTIQQLEPRIYEIFAERGGTEEKRLVLEGIFTRYVKDSIPLAEYLLFDPGEDDAIRGVVVEIFRALQLNRTLLECYNQSSGRLQLALAIALGENRILVGVPTLLEAMELPDLDVRRFASRSLKKMSGTDFGYLADGAPTARRQAIARWKEWWDGKRDEILKQMDLTLAGQDFDSEDRKRARQLLADAGAAGEQGNYKDAEHLLRTAIRRDPLFFPAHLHLAYLLYARMDRVEAGRRMLEGLVERRLPGTATRSLSWVHYHLGRINELEGSLERARDEYDRCLLADVQFFRANVALGEVNYRLATTAATASANRRQEQLDAAFKHFTIAQDRIEDVQHNLVLLYREDLPAETNSAIDMRDHNRRVLSAKADLRLTKARCLLGLARIQSLNGRDREAIRTLGKAIQQIDSAPSTTSRTQEQIGRSARELLGEIRNYLAILYESAGDYTAAYRQYRKVLRDVDSGDTLARDGMRRVERKLAPRRRN